MRETLSLIIHRVKTGDRNVSGVQRTARIPALSRNVVTHTKEPPRRAALFDSSNAIRKRGLLAGFANRILGIAERVVRGALRLVELALGLHLGIASDLPCSVFDRALDHVGGALHAFAIRVVNSC